MWAINLVASGTISILLLGFAELLGRRYIVTSAGIRERGFFFSRCRRLAWKDVTQVVLAAPVSWERSIQINAGRRKTGFNLGGFWWRPGFFRSAEAIVVLAKKHRIPIKKQGMFLLKDADEGEIERWFELGRKGLFWWAKAQLPPGTKGERNRPI